MWWGAVSAAPALSRREPRTPAAKQCSCECSCEWDTGAQTSNTDRADPTRSGPLSRFKMARCVHTPTAVGKRGRPAWRPLDEQL